MTGPNYEHNPNYDPSCRVNSVSLTNAELCDIISGLSLLARRQPEFRERHLRLVTRMGGTGGVSIFSKPWPDDPVVPPTPERVAALMAAVKNLNKSFYVARLALMGELDAVGRIANELSAREEW